MKTRLALLSLFLMAFVGFVSCEKPERAITFEQLPQTAQQFVNRHFGDCVISHVIEDPSPFDHSYKVYFSNRYEIEFDGDGQWTEVDCRADSVPTAIVPAAITAYVSQHYAQQFIVKISYEHREYEVELNTSLDLMFDKSGNFKYID